MKESKTDIQKINDEKKAYLNQYKNIVHSIIRLQEQRQENFENELCGGISYSGMPSSHNIHDLSDYAVRLESLDIKINKLQNERLKLLSDMLIKIESLEDEVERTIIEYRYIRCYNWEKIATEIKYSYRNTLFIHGKALKHFKL